MKRKITAGIVAVCTLAAVVLVVFLLSAQPTTGNNASGKVEDAVLESIASQGNAKVIVILKDAADETVNGKEEGNDKGENKEERNKEERNKSVKKYDKIVGDVIERVGAKEKRGKIGEEPSSTTAETSIVLRRRMSNAPVFSAEVNAEGLNALVADDDVERVELVRTLSVSLLDSTNITNAIDVWGWNIGTAANITGKNLSACVIDTGINTTHPYLTGRIRAQQCYCTITNNGGGGCCPNNQSTDTSAEDDHTSSHGTHVAGIIAANSTTLRGMAPEAQIVAVKVCDAAGSCDTDDVGIAIDYCVNNSAALNISVVSISIGGAVSYNSSTCPTSLDATINSAYNAGLIVAIASGNDGFTSGISYPGCSQNATAVGATTKSDGMASFTNRGGDRLDVLAPGQNINSTTRSITSIISGTSMATPHVSGAALLIFANELARGRTITSGAVETLLKNTGEFVSGYPRIDVLAALTFLNYNITINQSVPAVEKIGVARINYTADPDFSRFGECSNLSNNRVFINTTRTGCAAYNASARVAMFGLPYAAEPAVVSNGTVCSTSICTDRSYSSGTFSFGVSRIEELTTIVGSNLSVSDDTDDAGIQAKQSAGFAANFSNTTSRQPITTAVCELSANHTGSLNPLANMTYNASAGLYQTSIMFNSSGIVSWRALCTAASFESLNLTSTANITADITIPGILAVENGSITFNSVAISWNTTETANASVHYGTTTALGTTATNTSNTTTHNIIITGLTANTQYFYNVTSCDESGNCNTSGTRNFTTATDTVAPTIVSATGTPSLVVNRSNATFSITATDNIAVNATWTEIVLPNSSTIVMSVPINGSAQYNTTLVGQHNVTFFANDSANNRANSTTTFDVAERLSFTTSINARNSAGINANITFRRGSTSLASANTTNGSVSAAVGATTYDMEIVTNTTTLTLRSVNMSNATGNSLIIDRASVSGFLAVYGFNVTYNYTNATIVLSYAGTGFSDESALSVQRCADWNIAAASCSGSFADVTEYINTSDDTAIVNVTGFSAYAVKETTSTGNTGQQQSGGGGGGGGGGAGSCTNQCNKVAAVCGSYATVLRCADFNNDGCLELKTVSCGWGEYCNPTVNGCAKKPCEETWYCEDWRPCSGGAQTRTCVDLEGCGTDASKPETSKTCESAESMTTMAAAPETPTGATIGRECSITSFYKQPLSSCTTSWIGAFLVLAALAGGMIGGWKMAKMKKGL